MTHKGTVMLETERLILRRFMPEDAGPMFRNWANDPEVTRFLMWQTHADIEVSKAITNEWVGNYESDSYYQWAIVPKALGEPIGSIAAVKVDDVTKMVHIGYAIGTRWWHKGYTSEALTRLVKFFFEEVCVNRIESRHDPRNLNSGKVMLKAGLKYEGTLKSADYNNQGICDAAYYAILSTDYFNINKNHFDKTRENIVTVKRATDLMFQNLWISMETSDWTTDICGAPAWRYIYHTLHSADKYFINPTDFTEPPFHTPGLDWPDTLSDNILSRETLYVYYQQVRQKILDYIDSLTEKQLIDCPNCKLSRLGLILSQFRHMYAHIGILNGVTIARQNQYPRVLNESRKHSESLYDDDVRE